MICDGCISTLFFKKEKRIRGERMIGYDQISSRFGLIHIKNGSSMIHLPDGFMSIHLEKRNEKMQMLELHSTKLAMTHEHTNACGSQR